jgi:hypothetical protein
MRWVGPALGAIAFGLVLLGTRPPGPGLYGDSAGYLGAAESLVHTGRLRVPFAPYVSADSTAPMAQWPPGFSVAIAGPMLAGASAITGARIIVAASAAVTAILTVWLLGPVWGSIAVLVLGLSTSVATVYLNVLSEPPFIAAAIAAVALMATQPERPLRYGAVAAIALLFRYLGLAVVAACAVWAAVQPAPTSAVRIRRGALAALPGVIVYVVWSAIVRSGGAAVRHLHLDHFPVQSLRQFVGALLTWLGPDAVAVPAPGPLRAARAALKLVLVIGIVWIIARAWRRQRIVQASVLLAGACAGLLLVAQLLQSNVEFSDRMFSPVHALLDVGIVAALSVSWRRWPRAELIAGGVWALVSASALVTLVHQARTEGFYHAQRDIVESPLWRWVRDSARTRPAALYSNDVADVYFATHRPSRAMPWIVDADTARALEAALGRGPALIVWERGYTERVIFPELLPIAATPERLEALLPLRRVAVFPHGLVWAYGQ